VSEADAHDWGLRAGHQCAEGVDGVLAVGGVAWAVGDEDAVEMVGHFLDGVVEWETCHRCAAADEGAEDIFFHTAVYHGDVEVARGADVERSFGADLSNEVDLLGVDKSLILVGIVFLPDCDPCQRGTSFAEVGNNGSSVHTRNGGDAFAGTPLAKAFDCGPVGVFFRYVCYNDADGLDVGRFEVAEEAALVAGGGRDAVVSNEGLCEDENLAAVGRVGERLRIADEGGREDSLA